MLFAKQERRIPHFYKPPWRLSAGPSLNTTGRVRALGERSAPRRSKGAGGEPETGGRAL